MAANMSMSPVIEESFSSDELELGNLGSLSAAIIAATEKAESVAQETDRWLTGHQEFNNLDVVEGLLGEAEGRLVQLQQMTVIQELDRFMAEITVNAPADQASQLKELVRSTKDTFSSAIDSLEKFIQKTENIQKAYTKYKESASVLSRALNDSSATLQIISQHKDLSELSDQMDAVKSSRNMLNKMKSCLRNMKDAMAGIESLTLAVCDLGMDDYVKQSPLRSQLNRYKERRAELSEALLRLELVQSQMEGFNTLQEKSEASIAEINSALKDSMTDNRDLDHLRQWSEQVNSNIQEMENLVLALKKEGVDGNYQGRVSALKESYSHLINRLSAVTSTSYQSAVHASPLSAKSSPRRSPRRQTPSDPGTPRHSLRKWLRTKTDELQNLMSQPFPFEDKSIQSFWHSIQKYQGDLVVNGEEFSLYATEDETDQPAMDQITPLIDTCSDLSYRLDAHARLCVQYTADQNGLLAELRSLEEAKATLQHSEVPLRDQHRMCGELLSQVASLKRKVHDQLSIKLPPISINLAKKEGGALLSDTSELDAAVSKVKLEIKAFHQSLEASISNLDQLTRKLSELHSDSNQLETVSDNFTFSQPISNENVSEALQNCKRQLSSLKDKQQYVDKLLSKRSVSIGRLPSQDDSQLEESISQSKGVTEEVIRKLEQHQSNLSSLHQTVEKFDKQCEEAELSLADAEVLLSKAIPTATEEPIVMQSVEVVKTQCKTRLHECVTRLEQAEIAVTELQQKNSGLSEVEAQKDIVKVIQARHKTLSEKLQEVEHKMTAAADTQRALECLIQKFDDWMERSRSTVGEEISLTSGLNDMRDHIIRLHELEKSEESTVGWVTEMKKMARSLAPFSSKQEQTSLADRIAAKEKGFDELRHTLADKIAGLSKEMDVVITWIQKSASLSERRNKLKHQLSDLSNIETTEESISSKLSTLQSHVSSVEELQRELHELTSAIPAAVTEKQRKSSQNAEMSCDSLYSEVVSMHKTMEQTDRVWAQFKHLSGQVKDHLRHCRSQIEAVNVPGVSLDARRERYEEICEALEHYPEGCSPQGLQELLSTCPVASPTLYPEAIAILDDHEALSVEVRKGAAQLTKKLQARSALEKNLRAASETLQGVGKRVHSSLVLEDWNVSSCDTILRFLETEEQEVQAMYAQIKPMVAAQKEEHSSKEESMTLDLKDSIEEFEDSHRDVVALVLQEKEVLTLAREFCQYITESVEVIEAWLLQTGKLCEDIDNCNLPVEEIEEKLQSALSDVAGLRQHLCRLSQYTQQVADSLSPAARARLSELVGNLTENTNSRENSIAQLLDLHGELGQTRAQHATQYSNLEKLIDSYANQLTAADSAPLSSLSVCQRKLEQLQSIEAEEADIQQSVVALQETTNTLSKLIPPGNKLHLPYDGKLHPSVAEANVLEGKVKALCADRLSNLSAKLAEVKEETACAVKLYSQLEEKQKEIRGDKLQQVISELAEAESKELISLPLSELDKLSQAANKNSAVISQLWQTFLSAKDLESSLRSKVGNLSEPVISPEIATQLSDLASRCQKVESDADTTSTKVNRALTTLQTNFDDLKKLETEAKDCNSQEVEEMQAMQEHLQQLKSQVTKLYQSSNELVSSYGTNLPPEVSSAMNSIQNVHESLLSEIQQKSGQTAEIMEQYNVVHTIQQDLEKWISTTMQTISGDVVDSQIALTQQKDLEERVLEYNKKLSEFTSKSHDLENSLGSKESQRLLETISHFQKSFSGIKQGVDRRRSQVSQLLTEEENFHSDLKEVEEVLLVMEALVKQEVTEVNLEKCEKLTNEYQNELKKLPQLDQKLNDLATLSIRLADSSHNANTSTKVLDLKKNWARLKTLVTQQAGSLKETTKLLLTAPQLVVTHDEWAAIQQRAKSEAEDSLRDLHSKVDGSELMQTDEVMEQLKAYELEDNKLNGLSLRIDKLRNRKEKLSSASVDPLMVKDWAMEMNKINGELKQLYMKSEETLKRQSSIVEKANRLAAEGVKRECIEDIIAPVPTQVLNNGIDSAPAPVLDLSLDSDLCVEEVIVPQHSQRQSLAQDGQAARLFTVKKNRGSLEVEEKMQKMISEQQHLQSSVADVNREITKCQWTLDQDYHTMEELRQCLSSIQGTKAKLDGLSKMEGASHEPSLPVLKMSVETLELRCLSELQRQETNDSLSQEHQDTLDSIEEEVAACQKYLQYLETMPGGAEEKLPGVEHKVSKLQRMFQTLQLINPTLCEGSLVSEYLGQLMNDLQALQGRLEVIPEEGTFQSHGRELHTWQEHISEHLNRQEDDSDQEFIESILAELAASLQTLLQSDQSDGSIQPALDFLSVYKEVLSAAEKGVNQDRLVDAEQVDDHRENLQNLFQLFEKYRLYLGTLRFSSNERQLEKTVRELIDSTQSLQRSLWCQSERSMRLQMLTSCLYSDCDSLLKSLTQLATDYNSNQMSGAKLQKLLTPMEAEYHGLVKAVDQHLSESVRSPELREQTRSIQRVWSSLQELVMSDCGPDDEAVKLYTELMEHQNSQNSVQKPLDLSVPLNLCLPQALELLVELDIFNWIYKDLFIDGEQVDLDIKSSVLSIKPKINAIKSSLQGKLREFSPSDSVTLCKVYTWLGDVKPFNKQMATISEVHSFYLDLLTYQCNLSQRTYLTGLMMSLIASCDHDVIVASQHTLKSLHDAKVAASKQLSVSSSLRESYKRYSTMKKDFEKWINAVSCLCKDCPIGSRHSITWLLQQCEVLHASGVKLKQLKEDFVNESKSLSSKEMCSQVATKEANRNINELLNKQEACMLQLSSLADTLRAVDSGWTNFNRVYEESCLTLDDKESQFEMVPCLSVTNFVKEFERHVTHLQQILHGSEREADRIQSVGHNLRLSVTVPSVLQTLDKQTKSVKSRESKLYTQKLPLTIERWQKAQQLLVRYEKSCDQIRQLIQDVSSCLHTDDSQLGPKDLELSFCNHQKLLQKVSSIDWDDVKRQAHGIFTLTGLRLDHVSHLKLQVSSHHTQLVRKVSSITELCTRLSLSAQTIHSLENRLSRMERDPLLTSNSTKMPLQKKMERNRKTQGLLSALLTEKVQVDSLRLQTSPLSRPASADTIDGIARLEARLSLLSTRTSSKLRSLCEGMETDEELSELHNLYSDWRNRVAHFAAQPITGDVAELQAEKASCLFYITMAEVYKLSLTSHPSFLADSHEELVGIIQLREHSLSSLIQKHSLFERLKEKVTDSLLQLESQLLLPDSSYGSHVVLNSRVPKLKAAFEQHQRTCLVMRQICQELLPHCNGVAKTRLMAAVERSSSRWQGILSKLMSFSEESAAVVTNFRNLTHSLVSFVKEVGSVRRGTGGPIPEHQDDLLERQSQADVFDWKLEKLNTKYSVMRFEFTTLCSQVEQPTDMELCFSLSRHLIEGAEFMVADVKHELNDSLSVWNYFISDVNSTLLEIHKLEKLYLNERQLTIEELLEEMKTQYSADSRRVIQKAEQLVSKGTRLLTLTSDVFGSAIQHGVVSLQSAITHLTRLSAARASKLKDTMSAILEFESGMKSLNQWLKATEGSLNFTPADWQEGTVLANHQYLKQLEKEISHHSRTVTAVINLCSLLQYDKDAGYDITVKQELSAVKDRLKSRWKKLCGKIITKKEQLYDLDQVWSQMRSQTSSLISKLLEYKEKCDDHERSMSIRSRTHQFEQFSQMLKDCEAKHEDMRLLNNRLRYLTRNNMIDKSECVKKAVAQCTELWDTVYQSLSQLVKQMRKSHEVWTDFVKERDVLLIKVSNLSLTLKTDSSTRESVEEKLKKYQLKINSLLDLPVTNLRAVCTTEEHCRLDKLIQELNVSVNTLRCELRPQDDYHSVEKELELALHQTEDLEHDLESFNSDLRSSSSVPTSDLLPDESTLETDSKVKEIERRVDQIAQRAAIRRQLRPPISRLERAQSQSSALSVSSERAAADTIRSRRNTQTAHPPVTHFSTTSRSFSRRVRTRSADNPSSRTSSHDGEKDMSLRLKEIALSSPLPLTIKNLQAFNQSVLPSTFKFDWLANQGARSVTNTAITSATNLATTEATPPFQKYLNARRRSLSQERQSNVKGAANFPPNRTRSLSLERNLTGEALLQRSRSNTPTRQGLHNTLSPLPALSVNSQSTGFLLSAAPVLSSPSTKRSLSPLSVRFSPAVETELLSPSERREPHLDIKQCLQWMDKLEVLHTSIWSVNSVMGDNLNTLVAHCKHYNELLSQSQCYKAANFPTSTITQREQLSTRWKQVERYLSSRSDTLVRALVVSAELKNLIGRFADDITHAELKLLGGTQSKQTVHAEVRDILVSIRSYITSFTSLLCESESRGQQLLHTLRTCEVKCQNLLM